MVSLTGDEKVDRLRIIISCNSVDQLLAVPQLTTGTEQAKSDAIIQTINEWILNVDVKAFSFDTTSAITGLHNGTCTLLEAKLGHDALYLACRHHIHEIIVEEMFSSCFNPASSPEIQLFHKFKQFWSNVKQCVYTPGVQDEAVSSELDLETQPGVLAYAIEQLEINHPRDDYRELLEITIIFLEVVPSKGIKFMKPGAMHWARFLSRILYTMKMFIFRNSGFSLNNRELKGLKDIFVFAVKFNVKIWFSFRLGISAPKMISK